jgi:predicted dehydrogenase
MEAIMSNHLSDIGIDVTPDMPDNKRPIVIIGAGGIVTDAHLPAYRLAGFSVAAIYDLNPAKAEALAGKWNIPKACRTLEELVETGMKAGAVFDIAVPASEITGILPLLPPASGVLIQKPLGESLEQARAIVGICVERGLVAGVNLQLRCAPFMLAARRMIDRGLLGEIFDAEMRVLCHMPWSLWDFLFEKERMEINYHSIHYIDTVRYFLGNPTGVYCKTLAHPKMTDLAQTRTNIIFDYGDMRSAVICTNHGHDYAPDEQECFFKLEGTKGAIKLQIGVNLNYPKGTRDRFSYVLDNGEGWRTVDIPGTWFPDAFIGTMAGLQKKLEQPSYDYANSLANAWETMCVVEACYRSSAQGATPVEYGQ